MNQTGKSETGKSDMNLVNMNDRSDMNFTQLYKSVLDQDRAPVVLCGLDHTVLYMNSAAIARYARAGGAGLLGKSLMDCHGAYGSEMIERVVAWFAQSADNNIIYESRNDDENKDVYMVALRDEDGALIGYYEKHEYRARETATCYDFEGGSL